MTANYNESLNDDDDLSEKHDKPTAYRVEDDDNLEEKDLKRHYLFGKAKMKDANAPGMEGQGMGGQIFDQNNLTPSGDDESNPSQNAGYDNAYFRRTEPAEEHPENSNFASGDQRGRPNDNELPDQQKTGETKSKNTPNPQENFYEGTVDNDGQKESRPKSSTDNSAEDARSI